MWLAARSEVPVQMTYGSDCTPMSCRKEIRNGQGALAVRRPARATKEHLVEIAKKSLTSQVAVQVAAARPAVMDRVIAVALLLQGVPSS